MIAVCGIGMPSGCLNNAVTANQSASAPTMPASAAARTYPIQGAAPPLVPVDCAQVHTRKITVAPTRKLSATSFIRRSPRRRSASAAASAPASDSAKLGRGSAIGPWVGCPTTAPSSAIASPAPPSDRPNPWNRPYHDVEPGNGLAHSDTADPSTGGEDRRAETPLAPAQGRPSERAG